MEADFDTWMLVFLRVGAFLLVLPFFSMNEMPVLLRVSLAALISLLLTPVVAPHPLGQLDYAAILGLMMQEVGIGLLLGFLSRLIFFAAELAGSIIAFEMGLNLASVFDPMTQQASPIAGTLLMYLSMLVMLSLNLHDWMLLGFARTYDLLPIGGGHFNRQLLAEVVPQTSRVFMTALQISTPVIAASFVITMIFAVLSRAVPQMNVFTEMYGFKIVGSLVVLGFSLQLAAQYVAQFFNALPEDLLVVAKMIGGG